MKKSFFAIILFCILQDAVAQVPNQFNYQAVARNSLGQAIANANIRTRFTILDGSATGTNVYNEVRMLTTNQLGLFTAAIGGSGATSVTGNFATIDWSTGKKFIKVEVDPLGGTSFLTLGNTEMLSVPYALYAVNGKLGPQGFKSLLKTTPEAAGGNCGTGGQKIESGIDANNNNILDAGEISSTQFVCNGIQGFKTLLKTTNEVAGANCATGGQKIESGIDANNNNILEAGEVTSIAYTCNGVQGPQGLKSLIKTTAEVAGVNCTAGGTKIETGIDANSNNILDAGEITNTAFTCNGDVGGAWKTTGNGATTAANFIGTTDNNPLSFKVNGFEAMRINNSGNVGIKDVGLTDASLFVRRGINANGSAYFQGSTFPSTFHQGTNEDTYIRGGKAGSRVYINDVANTTTQIGWPALLTLSSSLRVNGSVSYSTKYVNDNYTLTDNDHILYCDLENDANRTINVNLPTPTAAREGRVYTILVLNAPTVSPGNAQANNGVVAILGTHGDQPIFNHWNSGWGTNPHKLFYVEQTCFLCHYMRWYRTMLSYICVNGKWQKLSDNEVICDEDI